MSTSSGTARRPRIGCGLNALLVAVALVGVLAAAAHFVPSFFSSRTTVTNNQVVASLTKEQQVVLLGLGKEGIVSGETKGQLFGHDIPGSERAQFVQYSYVAKLGLEGGQVKVEKAGDKRYRITVPEFVFIGHDKEQFKVAVEQDGALSWTAPKVDTATLLTEVLSEKAKEQHIAENRSTLEEQARTFYTGILKGIEPDATAEFVFTGH